MTETVSPTRKRRAYAARVPPEQRREQLLDAALRLISRDGYAGLTIEAIAAEAGVTKPVVYGAYAKLPALLGELLDRTQDEALTQLLAAFPATGTTGQHLPAEMTRAWASAVRRHPDTWAPILLTGAQTPLVVLDRIEQGRRLVCASVAGLLAGAGEPTRRHQLAAQALIAVAEHFGRMLLLSPGDIGDEELAALIDDLVRGALRPTRKED